MKKGTKKKATVKAAKKKATKKKKGAPKKATKKSVAKKGPSKKSKGAKGKKKAAKKAPATKRAAKKVSQKRPAKKAAPKKKAKRRAAPPPELPLGARAAPFPEPAITPDSPDAILLSLAKLLLDDAKYHDDVRLAVEAPEDYVDTFADALSLRGIEQPQPDLPWVALTDGLVERDALVQLDPNFEPSDLADALHTLLGKRSKRVDLAGLPGYGNDDEALQAVGDRLADAGLALVTVEPNEAQEALPIAILPADQVDQAQRLAASLGLGTIKRWSSATE